MLGDELFYKALHYYIQQWHSKHPMPLDFFNCMNKGSGRDLNWFWKKWFYETGTPDLGISKVVQTGTQKQITIESIGGMPVPVDMVVTFDDGSTKTFHQSIAAWEKGNKITSIKFTGSKKITKVQLGNVHTPDSNKKNNVWPKKS
jgi:aminopeptidase N